MTIPGALLSAEALADIRSIAKWTHQRDANRAFQFLEEIENSLQILVSSPFLGSPRHYPAPALHSLRRYQLPKFRNYGIFYRPFASANGIDVGRVLHSKQDDFSRLEELLDDDSD